MQCLCDGSMTLDHMALIERLFSSDSPCEMTLDRMTLNGNNTLSTQYQRNEYQYQVSSQSSFIQSSLALVMFRFDHQSFDKVFRSSVRYPASLTDQSACSDSEKRKKSPTCLHQWVKPMLAIVTAFQHSVSDNHFCIPCLADVGLPPVKLRRQPEKQSHWSLSWLK